MVLLNLVTNVRRERLKYPADSVACFFLSTTLGETPEYNFTLIGSKLYIWRIVQYS